jgi:predicted HTH domain antitoxin
VGLLLESSSLDAKLKEWLEYFRETKEVRRKYANWEFIRSQPPKIRIALEYYVETGDLFNAAKLAGMTMEEFNELTIKAGIPSIG